MAKNPNPNNFFVAKEKLNQKIMTTFKRTQISYLMIVVTLAMMALFAYMHITTSAEPPSVDSGTNLAVTSIMLLILLILASFITLSVSINEHFFRIKFGYGIFAKMFALKEIASVKTVKNHWYYGWGIRVWFWPYMWIFNVSGFDAVEIIMRNGKIYRIGTDKPTELEEAIERAMNS